MGPFTAQLSISDTQIMSFVDEDAGPFWMTPKERIRLREDEVVERFTTKEKNKSELLIALRNKGVDTTKKRYLKSDLILMCGEHNIDTTVTNAHLNPGWLNKPKGMLQVL